MHSRSGSKLGVVLFGFSIALAGSSVSSVASAQESQEEFAAPKPKRTWYGAQTLALDGISMTMIGVGAQDTSAGVQSVSCDDLGSSPWIGKRVRWFALLGRSRSRSSNGALGLGDTLCAGACVD